MKVRVKAFARFREILGSDLLVDLPDGATMAAVLAALRDRAGDNGDAIFDETGALRAHVILMRNGRRVKRDDPDPLADGDEIAIFPPVAGG
ncbi:MULTISPECIES: ubiquitin-like small modifier protein 1 [Methanoculleus]|jgi:molybdopterin synthase sulfur carrier subunit|uniref:Molybdopterin synthase sulfur carrier subunit n=1 Tax=Methanoculleus thermophilus TaxID=2200 RepID=A0A1G8ZFL9_9EURY|nr:MULTISPECIES: ubiquitin-like small modifier protein 1 [Methanoculleus]NLN08694.1 MoaD family protein [Methanoculleus thermophilus]SDK12960.1 molybdopterin synthase sulfur carrier subunit [Methanoculleus thermophilus]HQD27265.1 MoaD family protein [Methanoculleus thermophilus]